MKALQIFTDNNINMTRIQSKPSRYVKDKRLYEFYADFDGTQRDPKVLKAIEQLQYIADRVTIVGTPEVPWFPTTLEDLNAIGQTVVTKDNGGIIEVDHPSFTDKAYYQRRIDIGNRALGYKMTDPNIPIIDYTKEDNHVWSVLYPELLNLYKTHACKEFNDSIREFQKYADFRPEKVAQLDTISKFLTEKTGWRLKPVGGLLSQREFLNCLAFKVFCSS